MSDTGAAFDLGGGSCQLMYFERGNLPEYKSMPIGALRMYNRHVSGILPNSCERLAIERDVRRNLSDFGILKGYGKIPLFAMGGAACTLHTICKRLTGKDKVLFNLRDLEQITLLDENTISKVAPNRLTTIIPAIITIIEILKYIGTDQIHITDVGVRNGILNKIVSQNIKGL